MILSEPSTVVTDVLISVVCLYAWIRLRGFRQAPRDSNQRSLLSFFALMGLSTLLSAFLSHGFSHVLTSFWWKLPGWLLNIVAISCLGLCAALRRPQKRQNTILVAIMLETLTVIIWTFLIRTFLPAEVHMGIVLLLFMLPLQLMHFRERDAKLTFLAILVLLPTPLVLMSQWSPVSWLNANDVSHLLIAMAIYVIYLAHAAEPAEPQ